MLLCPSFQLLLITAILAHVQARCPPVDVIFPCVCRTHFEKAGGNYDILSCYHLNSEVELQHVLTATSGFNLFELELVDSSLRFFPHDVFLNATFEILSIRNSSIHALSDSDFAFEGLDDTLRLLEIVHCSYTSNWKWTQLSRLRRLDEIHVTDSPLIDVTDGISSIQHLDIGAFVFQKNNILELADGAFAPFVTLERLALDNNNLSEIKRSMLPSPAINLTILGLSYNKLNELPSDLFHDMPSLKSLYLTGNPLYTIDEVVFKPIWNQLDLLLIEATRVSCDCAIEWMTKENNSKKFIHGECRRPMRFKGRLLSSVKTEELGCDALSWTAEK